MARKQGTVTKDPEVYKTYIASKQIETRAVEDLTDDETITVEKIEERGWTGFHKDENTNELFIYNYMIKGFLKHAGNVLKAVVKIKALRSKLDDFVFILPRRIYLGQSEPDGVLERPLRVMTMQGPRVCLARSDYIKAGKELVFTIKLYPHPEIDWEVINQLLAYGEDMGLGQFRNGSYGTFIRA